LKIKILIQIYFLIFFKTYINKILFSSPHRVEQNDKDKIYNKNHMIEVNYFKI
jgi:hypothetical protein